MSAGRAAIAIEAKRLGTSIGAKEAGQVVGYCSNLGVRWGAVTDGRGRTVKDYSIVVKLLTFPRPMRPLSKTPFPLNDLYF